MESQNLNKNLSSHYCKCCGLIEGDLDTVKKHEIKQEIKNNFDDKDNKYFPYENLITSRDCCVNVQDNCNNKKMGKDKNEKINFTEELRNDENIIDEQEDIQEKNNNLKPQVTICAPKKENEVGENRYVIKEMVRLYTSSDLITPYEPPRQTQSTVRKYIVRADGHDLEYTDRDTNFHELVSKNWADDNKESWVPRPEEDGIKIYNIFNKYGMKYDYNPQKIPKQQLFPRPYSLEIDCLKEYRHQGVEKCNPKNLYKCEPVQRRQDSESKDSFMFKPPFWWLGENTKKHEPKRIICTKQVEDEEMEKKHFKLRWRPVVNLSEKPVNRDWCERRLLMANVGSPYKHEACNFYYKNYPSPSCSLTKIKFST